MGDVLQFPGVREPMVSLKQLLKEWPMSESWVRQKVRAGELPHYRTGTARNCKILFRPSEVERWMRENGLRREA